MKVSELLVELAVPLRPELVLAPHPDGLRLVQLLLLCVLLLYLLLLLVLPLLVAVALLLSQFEIL